MSTEETGIDHYTRPAHRSTEEHNHHHHRSPPVEPEHRHHGSHGNPAHHDTLAEEILTTTASSKPKHHAEHQDTLAEEVLLTKTAAMTTEDHIKKSGTPQGQHDTLAEEVLVPSSVPKVHQHGTHKEKHDTLAEEVLVSGSPVTSPYKKRTSVDIKRAKELGSYEILSPPLESGKPALKKLASYTNPIREDTDDDDTDDDDNLLISSTTTSKQQKEDPVPPESNRRPSLGGKRASSSKIVSEKMGRRNSAPTRSELRAREIGTYEVFSPESMAKKKVTLPKDAQPNAHNPRFPMNLNLFSRRKSAQG